MNSDNAPTDPYASPFDTGQWQGWTNLERFNWLRAFLNNLNKEKKAIEKQFKLDKSKMKRLAEAVDVLEAVVKEELAMLEKRVAYNEAMRDLAMDEALKSDMFEKFAKKGIPTIVPVKAKKRFGN
jgi:predicted  nucleic acid-binding Zn-ribbon protein